MKKTAILKQKVDKMETKHKDDLRLLVEENVMLKGKIESLVRDKKENEIPKVKQVNFEERISKLNQ